ncbi:hypothetical protein OU798_07310 [Prolixibacteraceae bacterium Z1-6]|uniref:Phage tail protein n=1 Tax=Draconibacterium aestuarii TaxID=2998507 RepID=A0A9X3F420_9BACT|nr:hypothetical protein [Prolixibacteraceae bacterium Z1-6]
MLSLTINNKPLLTGQKFSCRISVKNPFFLFNEIRGPLAADISLPVEGNRGALGNPNRVTKRAKQNDRHFSGAKLLHFGLPLIEGDFVVNNALGTVEGWIQNNLGKLGEELREKNLTELDFGDACAFVNKTTFDPDSDSWCTLRLMNRGFWKDKGKMVESDDGTDIEELTNKFEALAGFFVNQSDTGGVITSANTDGAAVVSPYPFLHSLLDTLLRKNRFYISDNFLKLDADLKTLCLYHNYNILKDTSTIEEQTFALFNFFTQTEEELNLDAISASTWDLAAFNIHDLVPDIDIKKFFLGVQNTFNTFFWFNNNRTVQIIDREGVLKGQAFDLSQYRVSEWKVGERKDVALKFSWDHDNNDSAFNERWENLDDKRDRILDAVNSRNDLNSIILPKEEGDIRLVLNENMYYEYGWFTINEISGGLIEIETVVKGWKPVSIGLQNYFFNDGDKDQEEIKSDFSTLRMAPEGYPVAYQNGNSKTFSSVREPFSPRLMFYKGNNTGGDESVSGKKFDWKGDSGFVFSRYRLTAPFLAGRLPIEADFRFPPRILHYVMNNIYQKMKDSECEFMIEQLDADPGPEEETLVRIQAYKLEDNFWSFNPGVVPGGGDGTEENMVPKFVGVNKYGKPYIVDETGKFKTTSVFGDISTAAYAHHCCVDYHAASNQLFIGGNNGYVHIYDLSDGIRMQSLRMGTISESISGIKVANGKVMVGINNQRQYCYFNQGSFDNYSEATIGTVTGGSSEVGYTIRDFEYYNGYYYMCSAAGEIMRCDATIGQNPKEITDRDTEFICMAQSSSRMYVFSDNDREFSCLKTNTDKWSEFRMLDGSGSDRPPIWEATPNGNNIIALSSEYTHSLFVLESPSAQTRINIGGYGMGAAVVGSDVFIASGSYNLTSGQLYKLAGSQVVYQFNLPDCMSLYAY